MIQNKVDEIMTQKGLKPKWVVEEYNKESGLSMDYMALYNIRRQFRQPSSDELFWLSKIFRLPINKIIFNLFG